MKNKTEQNALPVRVLAITGGGTEFGGIMSYLNNYYREMDQSKVRMDFLFTISNSLGERAKDPVYASSNFYELSAMRAGGNNGLSNFFRQFFIELPFFREHKFDVIYINTGSELGAAMTLFAAKLMRGGRTLIAHSHSAPQLEKKAASPKKTVRRAASSVCRLVNRTLCTHMLACSEYAGEFMFGRKAVKSGRVQVINNAIDLRKFKFSEDTRKAFREAHGVKDGTAVFCHVGAFARVKNHVFLIDVFNEIHKKNKNTVLWLIGDAKLGPYKPAAIERVRQYGLDDCVVFWGQRTDVEAILCAADGMIFPSLFEGLSVVAVEAQASGLPIYASKNVFELAKMTDTLKLISLSDGAEKWAEYILRDMASLPPRRSRDDEIAERGFDVRTEAKKLQEIFTGSV